MEELSQYLRLASRIQVELSIECKNLLYAYFRVMRKRVVGLECVDVSTVSTMCSLLNLASCHAKQRGLAVRDWGLSHFWTEKKIWCKSMEIGHILILWRLDKGFR
ncbi:hypothetical protein BGW38_009258 [Lunasporangiospora selenospora]|uniref:Uncharacterized protein n=1 Tax=Lunasporangiospora selenospora TaxID=979761 RepID=A0A9P6FX73_9FUNG|nr:hypothetical protein BGW38_009258 [Lunasporangiospora selenospora]